MNCILALTKNTHYSQKVSFSKKQDSPTKNTKLCSKNLFVYRWYTTAKITISYMAKKVPLRSRQPIQNYSREGESNKQNKA